MTGLALGSMLAGPLLEARRPPAADLRRRRDSDRRLRAGDAARARRRGGRVSDAASVASRIARPADGRAARLQPRRAAAADDPDGADAAGAERVGAGARGAARLAHRRALRDQHGRRGHRRPAHGLYPDRRDRHAEVVSARRVAQRRGRRCRAGCCARWAKRDVKPRSPVRSGPRPRSRSRQCPAVHSHRHDRDRRDLRTGRAGARDRLVPHAGAVSRRDHLRVHDDAGDGARRASRSAARSRRALLRRERELDASGFRDSVRDGARRARLRHRSSAGATPPGGGRPATFRRASPPFCRPRS